MPRLLTKTPPTVEPVSLSEAKNHLRVDFTDDDALIQGEIRSARTYLERKYNRAFCTQTLVLDLDSFDPARRADVVYAGIAPSPWAVGLGVVWSVVELRPPVASITSVKYTDTSGVQQTLATNKYVLDNGTEPGRLYPAFNLVWPATAYLPGAVKVEFIAGLDPGLVTDDAKQAHLLLVAEMYAYRELTITERVVKSVELNVDQLMGWSSPPLLR